MQKKRSFPSMEELLAQLPDTGLSKGKESNEVAEFVAAHPETWGPPIQITRGRPKRGAETGSIPKSIRFPKEIWDRIKEKATRLNLPVHAAMRKALLDWAATPDEISSLPITPQPFNRLQVIIINSPSLPQDFNPNPILSTTSTNSFEKLLNLHQGSDH